MNLSQLSGFKLDKESLLKVVGGVMSNSDCLEFVEQQISAKYPLKPEEKQKLKEFAKNNMWPQAKQYLLERGYSADLLDDIFCEIL